MGSTTSVLTFLVLAAAVFGGSRSAHRDENVKDGRLHTGSRAQTHPSGDGALDLWSADVRRPNAGTEGRTPDAELIFYREAGQRPPSCTTA